MNLIDPDQLANMLGLKRKTVIDQYIKQPGFPQSVTGPRKPRWLESAVVEFWKRKSAHSSHTPRKGA